MDLSASGNSAGEGGADRSYDVVVAHDALLELGSRLRAVSPGAQRALLVVDGGLPDGVVGKAVGSIASAGVRAVVHTVRASERAKSLGTLEGVLHAAMRERLEREEPFVALGGGIVGDVAGFAAAVYRRGVAVIQCPTTLLAMVDASVGGKTGVNLAMEEGGGLRKNMVGAFWQPSVVLCDLESLASLSEREYRAGLAECLKHALIGSAFGEPGLLDWMLDRAAEVAARRHEVMAELIARNVAVKCRVVAGDERETLNASATGRGALNAGHTLAHAIESAFAVDGGDRDDHGVLHGEAVGLGLIGEVAVAESMGLLGDTVTTYADRVTEWVARLGLPTRLPGPVSAERLIEAMRDDKKVAGGRIRLMSPTPDRRVVIVDDPTAGALRGALERLGAAA